MSRTRRQWLGYFLALLLLLLLYRYRRSSEPNTQPALPDEHEQLDDSFLDPEFVNPDFQDEPEINPPDVPTHDPVWKNRPLRFPVNPNLLPPKLAELNFPTIQASSSRFSDITTWFQKSRQAAVKDAFVNCWESYKSLAWQADELAPVSGLPRNGFGGWGLTLVDNLDTLWIMGMRGEFDKVVATVAQINFDETPAPEINTHAINIHILGGLLGAYELSTDRRLLVKAIQVGDMLYAAFDTPNRMPIIHWDFHRALREEEQIAEDVAAASNLGSFILEFTKLSQLTGDPKYFDAAQLVMEKLERLQDTSKLPGLWPVVLNARTEASDGDFFTLGAEADLLYKTLPKAYTLLGGRFPMYRKMYERSTRTIAGHNLFRPMIPSMKDILVPGSIRVLMTQNGKSRTLLETPVHQRSCFLGGLFAFGGTLFNIPAHRQIANKLVDGCIWAAQAMPLGIMPEIYDTVPCESQTECTWNDWLWKQEIVKRANQGPELNVAEFIHEHRLPKGFTSIPDTRYNLRPETIESMFTLYRVSAREDLLDTAWEMFNWIQNTTEIINGNAALADVTSPEDEPPLIDSMESLWMSQTLKYFYLMFSSPEQLSLDKYVFNAAGHPLKRPETEWIP